LFQKLIKETNETKFKTDCLHFLVAICIQMKKMNSIVGRSCYQLCISDLIAAEDLTKYHSSITNVVLHFPHLVPEHQLDFLGDE